jgi:hypothetical protein
LADLSGLRWNDRWLFIVSDFAAGFGDFLSFGLTKKIRRLFDFDDVVARCTAYKLGAASGILVGAATVVASAFNAGANTVLYSGEGALEAALAAKGEGIIIAETLGGRVLNAIGALVRVPQGVWKAASAVLAANATGVVQVFLRNPLATGIWNTIERPIVEFLGNATIWIR